VPRILPRRRNGGLAGLVIHCRRNSAANPHRLSSRRIQAAMNLRITLLLGLSCLPITCRSNASTVEDHQHAYSTHVSNTTSSREWVDSAVPIEEALRRFQADIPEPVTQFSHGAQSRDALIRQFATAVEKEDTASLTKLAVSRAEFAYLYYPNHPKSQPPYELSPQLMWFQMTARSEKGLRRILRDFGGQQMPRKYACADSLQIQNGNTVWTGCAIEIPTKEQKRTVLFSAIIEREGSYKILSYSNNL